MERARKAFDDKGLKLTPLRRAVFGEIAASHKAIGAYEVLDKLAARGERLAPISVYRAMVAGGHEIVLVNDGSTDTTAQVLDKLAARGERLAPISVYRAIDALLAAGIVHRFESRNAFFACHAGHDVRTRHLVLSCESCGRIAEVDGNKAFAAIDKAAASAAFSPEGAVVEVRGRCADCTDAREEAAV